MDVMTSASPGGCKRKTNLEAAILMSVTQGQVVMACSKSRGVCLMGHLMAKGEGKGERMSECLSLTSSAEISQKDHRMVIFESCLSLKLIQANNDTCLYRHTLGLTTVKVSDTL